MDNYELAQKTLVHCGNDLVMELSPDEHIASLSEALDEIEQQCPVMFEVIKRYFSDAVENTMVIRNRVCDDLINLLDNECEVFDPICDGSVEHAEGMAAARELIAQYKDDKVERRFINRQ